MLRVGFCCLSVLLAPYLELVDCFNIQYKVETLKFLTSPLINQAGSKGGLVPKLPTKAKPTYYGIDIAIQKLYTNGTETKTETSIVIGSPKLKNASSPMENIKSSAGGSTGGIFACKIAKDIFKSKQSQVGNSACSLTIPKPATNPKFGDDFGMSVPSPPFYSGSFRTCTSTRSVRCSSLNYMPGICYETKNSGKTWVTDATSSKEVCPQKNVDVVFVLDGSLSVLAGNFERVKKWVSNITKQLNIDKGSVRVGVLQYAEKDKYITEIALEGRRSYASFKKSVQRIRYINGKYTYTGEALDVVRKIFKESPRHKKNSRQVMILLTDGKSSDHNSVKPNAEKLRAIGVETYAVGVAKAVKSELKDIAGKLSRVFSVDKFENLHGIIDKLQKAILVSLEGSTAKNISLFKFELAETGFSSAYGKKKNPV